MPKTVVIVEDDDEQRTFYLNALRRRGFRAEGAARVDEAFQIIEELGDEIDVMLLDMRLLDPDSQMTGAEIAIQVRDKHPDWTPECVIKTAFPYEVDYYRMAICLGVTAYLSIEEVSESDVLRHIRALALKRSLRVDRPKVMAALNAISESTKNLAQAVVKFCRDMLAQELNVCLGTPYILLLSDEWGTQNVATNSDLPGGYQMLYSAIQEMAHSITKPSSQYVISENDVKAFPVPTTASEEKILERLPGAALLPLAKAMNFRLSLVLFVARPEESKLPEETGLLAAVLAQHVRPSIFEHFLGILIQLDAQNRMMLTSTSQFCLYIGQEQERIITEGIKSGGLQKETDLHYSLATMANDLRRTGTILDSAASDRSHETPSAIEMKSMVEKEFADLSDMIDFGNLKFCIEGSCQVNAGDDLAIAVKRLLQWFIQRRSETPTAVRPEVHVRCMEREQDSQIIFEDRSRRLPKGLREQLFEPFSTSVARTAGSRDSGPGLYLPLYLAKVLVEEKYGGRLSDESDTMDSDIGHMVMMCFRPPRGQPTINSL